MNGKRYAELMERFFLEIHSKADLSSDIARLFEQLTHGELHSVCHSHRKSYEIFHRTALALNYNEDKASYLAKRTRQAIFNRYWAEHQNRMKKAKERKAAYVQRKEAIDSYAHKEDKGFGRF